MKIRNSWLFTIILVILLSFSVIALADVKINETSFPDETFREFVRQFDTDGNGSFSDEELAKVESIEVSEKEISSLQGLEYFTALKELRCSYNHFTSLDISKNTALTFLECCFTPLTSLDVSKNTSLTYLWCQFNQLTSLDLSKNTALRSLDFSGDPITSLDLSKNTALTELRSYDNQLTSLDVSKNTELRSLTCTKNLLTTLDVSKNTLLVELYCCDNQLTSLDVSSNTDLWYFECHRNPLTSLKLSKNLKMLRCYETKLTSLDIRKCTELMNLAKGVEPMTYTTQWGDVFFGWCDDIEYLGGHYLFIDKGLNVITDGVSVSKIKLNKTKATLTKTSSKKTPTLQLKATVLPKDAADPSVEWKSSDPKIAKVDKNGKVTALKAGKVTITCSAKDGSDVKATCKITVKDQMGTKLTLNKKTISLKKGKTFQLKVTITPSETQVKWNSSDKTVATVDKNGKVKAIGKGTCVITCESQDGSGKKATCEVSVK